MLVGLLPAARAGPTLRTIWAPSAHRRVTSASYSTRTPQYSGSVMTEPPAKRARDRVPMKTEGSFSVTGLHVTDYVFTVPLDHSGT